MERFPILAAAALACACVLAACGQLQRAQDAEIYEATLNGAQEVPAVATGASGQAEVVFHPHTRMIRWKVTHTGLSGPVTAAHIHGPAGPGQSAGPQIPLTGSASRPLEGGDVRLSSQQANELSSGQWYVNLHTARHPDGEIRGQLRPRR